MEIVAEHRRNVSTCGKKEGKLNAAWAGVIPPFRVTNIDQIHKKYTLIAKNHRNYLIQFPRAVFAAVHTATN